MNKTLITGIIAFTVGGVASFLLTRKILEKKYAERAEEEIESIREMYKEKEKDLKALSEIPIPNHLEIPLPTNPNYRPTPITSQKVGIRTNPYEEAKSKYNISSPRLNIQIENEEGEDEDEDMDEKIKIEERDRDVPYVIDYEDFANEFKHHDKITLFYYSGDDTLADENEAIIDDIEMIVGYDSLVDIEVNRETWVRNERLGSDFEIVCEDKSYQEVVLGMVGLSPRERQQIKTNNRSKRRGGADEDD